MLKILEFTREHVLKNSDGDVVTKLDAEELVCLFDTDAISEEEVAQLAEDTVALAKCSKVIILTKSEYALLSAWLSSNCEKEMEV